MKNQEQTKEVQEWIRNIKRGFDYLSPNFASKEDLERVKRVLLCQLTEIESVLSDKFGVRAFQEINNYINVSELSVDDLKKYKAICDIGSLVAKEQLEHKEEQKVK